MHLMERDQLLANLDEYLDRAASGTGQMVMIGGEAGAGKTSLVRKFMRTAGNRATTLTAACEPLPTPTPLGPIRDLAPALRLQIEPDAPHHDERDALARAMLAALTERRQPTVIAIEDAHWADGASLDLLRFLGRRLDRLPVLLLVTYRDDEIGADHPLRLLLGDLTTTPNVHRLQVPLLSPEAVSQLAAGTSHDAEALHRLTGGNPFYVSEVLAADRAGIPVTVSDAVLARALRLSPDARAVLGIAAVIGSPIAVSLLLEVAGPVVAEIDQCVIGGLLIEHDTSLSMLSFRHELARIAILNAIPPLRRRQIHGQILERLRQPDHPRADLATLAHHAEAAADQEAVREFAIAAARQATGLHAYREAAGQYARALRAGGTIAGAERAALLEAYSYTCYLSDQGAAAIAAREEAITLRHELGDRLQEGENLRWLSRLAWFNGDSARAEVAGARAVALLETLPPGPQLAMAYSNQSQLAMLADDLPEAVQDGERAMALAKQFGEQETYIHALCNVGTARMRCEDPRGLAELEDSLRLAMAAGYVDHAGRALVNLSWSSMTTLNLADARGWLNEGFAYITANELDHYLTYLTANQATFWAYTGRWDDAIANCRQVLTVPDKSPLGRIVALTTLGQIMARRGDPSADELLAEALDRAEFTGQLLRLGPVRAARAEAALLAGDAARARAELHPIRQLASERGPSWQRGEIVWLSRQAGVEAPPPPGLPAPYLHLLAGEWEAAAAAWTQIGCPYDAARALAQSDDPDLIRQAIATFEQMRARPALRQAIQRLRALGVRDLPAMPRGPRATTLAHPAGLTQRETEILELLAMDLRNADIASRLFLTPKTVSHHLSAIYAKLGVSNRADAIRIAQSGHGPRSN
jgi:DNA-binding CsgD family transcriptional regulator